MASLSKFQVDFSKYDKDLITQELDRMLGQHYDKCVLRQFVAVFIRACQELYDACIELQRMRTAFDATEYNLDALGRIVGEDRALWEYNDEGWFYFDRQGQSFEQQPMWCLHGPLETTWLADDTIYRTNIILKAIRNHTLTSSIPELDEIISLVFTNQVSFEKTGPNEVALIVPSDVSMTQLKQLTVSSTDEQVDNRWFMNYPATLDVRLAAFAPSGFAMSDTLNRGSDTAPVAVGVLL